jgi:uncharacterized phage protein (TIGR01671 family)
MREIKFRAWCLPQYEGDAAYMGEVREWRINDNGTNTWNCIEKGNEKGWQPRVTGMNNRKDDVILLQFTGLNDEDSNPIYEGDIVDFYDEDIGYSVGKICFEAGMFIIACDKFEDSYKGLNEFANSEGWCDYVRVKGDIYQNPDLFVIHDLNEEVKNG